MRIIAGKHRGRRLVGPKSDAIRPTTDRVRESLFAILDDFDDQVVIDGYAGTGALGCEALSRGAEHVFFFDSSRAAIELIRQNVESLGELEHATIVARTFDRAISAVDRDVDVVFLDPPYGSDEPRVAFEALLSSPHVTSGALVVLEQAARDDEVAHEGFELDDVRVYGDTRISFHYRR